MIKRLFARAQSLPPSVPDGQRIYAIGDVHGRLDLLDRLLASLESDASSRGAAQNAVVLLGDLIDRGAQSAGVLERVMEPPGWATFHMVQGNHEDTMLATLDGDRDMCRMWLRNGGDAALTSWGISPEVLADGTLGEVIDAARKAIPPDHVQFIRAAPHGLRIGDYYFVHAGVRPGIEIEEQLPRDSMWIRSEFLESKLDHGAFVVHGHSVTADVEERTNRIGLDTGAYASGKLTALGLERDQRWIIQTD